MSESSRKSGSEFSNARRMLQNAMIELDRVAQEMSCRQTEDSRSPETPSQQPRETSSSRERLDSDNVAFMRSTALAAEQRRLFGRSSGHSRRHSSRPSGRHGSSSRSSQTTTSHAYGRSTKRQMITIHAICLSDHQQSIPPSRETKLKLSLAGLGEQDISVGHDDDALEVHNAIVQTFSPLERAGYEMMRLTSRRTLEVLRTANGILNARNVKAALNQAKLYLRPIKHSLPLTDTSQRPTVR